MSLVGWNRRDRRALVGGAIVMLVMLGSARALPALIARQREIRAEDVEARDMLARERGLIARADQSRESTLVRGHRMIALAPAILVGDSPNAAGATLAALLSGAAAVSNIRLGTVQLRADSLSHEAFTRVGARVVATGDVRGVLRMLDVLDRGPTLLAVRSVAITQPDPAAGDDRIEALHVELEIEGLMLNPRRAR